MILTNGPEDVFLFLGGEGMQHFLRRLLLFQPRLVFFQEFTQQLASESAQLVRAGTLDVDLPRCSPGATVGPLFYWHCTLRCGCCSDVNPSNFTKFPTWLFFLISTDNSI